MRPGNWIWAGVALLAALGCHRKPAVVDDSTSVFSNTTLASGSTGDTMSQLAKQYGIPIYPGSVPDTSHFNSAANANARVYLAYTTADPTDRVVTFYHSNMNLSPTTSGAVTVLSGVTHDGSQITINVGQKMDGTGTSFAIIVTPNLPPAADTTVATAAPTTTPTQPTTTPPPTAAPKDMSADNTQQPTTYYVPTSNSPPDDSTTNSSDQGDGSQSTQSGDTSGNDQPPGDQTNGQQGQGQTTGGSDQSQTTGSTSG